MDGDSAFDTIFNIGCNVLIISLITNRIEK